jgi:LAO/AO transport system kinase
VTKADLGKVATRAVSDLKSALNALGAGGTPVISVSSIAPPVGVGHLVDALDAHKAGLDVHARRVRARRMHALADFEAEYGARGLRALGGRRAAERWLSEQDPGLDVPAILRLLNERAEAQT